MNNEGLDFREQIEHAVADRGRRRVTISLLSGQAYTIGLRSQIHFYERLVTLLKEDGGEAFFPFEAICNVDVEFLDS